MREIDEGYELRHFRQLFFCVQKIHSKKTEVMCAALLPFMFYDGLFIIGTVLLFAAKHKEQDDGYERNTNYHANNDELGDILTGENRRS